MGALSKQACRKWLSCQRSSTRRLEPKIDRCSRNECLLVLPNVRIVKRLPSSHLAHCAFCFSDFPVCISGPPSLIGSFAERTQRKGVIWQYQRGIYGVMCARKGGHDHHKSYLYHYPRAARLCSAGIRLCFTQRHSQQPHSQRHSPHTVHSGRNHYSLLRSAGSRHWLLSR